MDSEVLKILRGAEKDLQGVIQDRLRAHCYNEVASIAAVADQVRSLAEGGARPEKVKATPGSKDTPGQSKTKARVRGRSRQTASAYPRYERDGDRLVKLGWSKKHREVYEHRANKSAVIAFARTLAGAVVPGEVFRVDSILPVFDSETESNVPEYQIYLAMGWLRHAGAIEKSGRDGYVLVAGAESPDTVDHHWQSLPTRSNTEGDS